MTNGVQGDDGEELVCEQGAHGLGAEVFDEEVAIYYDMANGVCIDPNAPPPSDPTPFGQKRSELCNEFREAAGCTGHVATRSIDASKPKKNTFRKRHTFATLHHGKLHRYPLAQWELVAPHWQRNLLNECELRLSLLLISREAVENYSNPDGVEWVVAGTSKALASFKAWWSESIYPDCPKLKEFDQLIERVKKAHGAIANQSTLDYELLWKSGLELMRVDRSERRLMRQYKENLDQTIQGAETAVKGLTVVESSAFAALDLSARVYAMGDPMREAAYRIGTAGVHAAAKGFGELVASNGARRVFQAFAKQIRADAPGILSDAFVSLIGKRIGLKDSSRLQVAAKSMIGNLIQIVFEGVDLLAFELAGKSHAERKAKLDEFERDKAYSLIAASAQEVVVAILTPPGLKNAPKSAKNTARNVGAAVATAVIGGLLSDWRAAEKQAAKEHKKTFEVFFAEIGWTIVRIATSAGVAVSRASMQSKVETEVKSGETSVFGKKLYWDSRGEFGQDGFRATLGLKRPPEAPKAKPMSKPPKGLNIPRRNRRGRKTKLRKGGNSAQRRKYRRAWERAVRKELAKKQLTIDGAELRDKVLIFYSGTGSDGISNHENAMRKYRSDPKRFAIIDETDAGKYLASKTLRDSPLTRAQVDQLWTELSIRYAKEAKGPVLAFVDKASEQRVFAQDEWRELGENRDVTHIISNERDRDVLTRNHLPDDPVERREVMFKDFDANEPQLPRRIKQ